MAGIVLLIMVGVPVLAVFTFFLVIFEDRRAFRLVGVSVLVGCIYLITLNVTEYRLATEEVCAIKGFGDYSDRGPMSDACDLAYLR